MCQGRPPFLQSPSTDHLQLPAAPTPRQGAEKVAHLLVGVLEGEGGGGAILPRLGAEVVVEAGAGGHGLGVEVGGERAVLEGRGRGGVSLSLTHKGRSEGKKFSLRLRRLLHSLVGDLIYAPRLHRNAAS